MQRRPPVRAWRSESGGPLLQPILQILDARGAPGTAACRERTAPVRANRAGRPGRDRSSDDGIRRRRRQRRPVPGRGRACHDELIRQVQEESDRLQAEFEQLSEQMLAEPANRRGAVSGEARRLEKRTEDLGARCSTASASARSGFRDGSPSSSSVRGLSCARNRQFAGRGPRLRPRGSRCPLRRGVTPLEGELIDRLGRRVSEAEMALGSGSRTPSTRPEPPRRAHRRAHRHCPRARRGDRRHP